MEEGDAVDGEERERERDTKHAPDLLEGPSINSEGLARSVNYEYAMLTMNITLLYM